MIEWWGPVLFEYYSSTEGLGATAIISKEWLTKPGSVGKPILGSPVILDDSGNELQMGEIGTIWFSGGIDFEYHDDPERTQSVHDASSGRSTVGDMGHIDSHGYLFISDRRTNLVISGGVNIYPQEIEDVLVMHPNVTDVAVIGLPDSDLGQRVVAVVQPTANTPGGELTEALLAHCKERLALFKVPREIRYVDSLPRTPTGKMRKHLLATD